MNPELLPLKVTMWPLANSSHLNSPLTFWKRLSTFRSSDCPAITQSVKISLSVCVPQVLLGQIYLQCFSLFLCHPSPLQWTGSADIAAASKVGMSLTYEFLFSVQSFWISMSLIMLLFNIKFPWTPSVTHLSEKQCSSCLNLSQWSNWKVLPSSHPASFHSPKCLSFKWRIGQTFPTLFCNWYV